MTGPPNLTKTARTPLFFIIGRARSGTTLIRTLFDAHPNVNIPVESPFIVRLHRKYAKIRYWDKNKLLRFFDDLQKVLYFENWNIDREKLKTDLLLCEGYNKYQTICKVVICNYSSIFEKHEILVYGDKNPVYSLSINKLFKLYPDSKYIYLTRDYRDHILSMLRTELYTPDILALAYRWCYSVRLMKKLIITHPESFLTVRYEDFIQDPYLHLEKMCNFIGIEFKPEVLEFHKHEKEAGDLFPREMREKFFNNLFKPIDASRIYMWKKQMADDDVRKVDCMVGKWAEYSGYERKYKDPEPPVLFKVIPVKLYLGIYYSLSFIRRRLPRWLRSRKHSHVLRKAEE
jgi:hypothetical protein